MLTKFAVLAPVVGVWGSSTNANPIRRIVTLLQDMQKEIEADGKKEEALFKEFMCYCKTNKGQLSADTEQAIQTMEINTAAAKEKEGLVAQLTEELKQHKADRADATSTLSAATETRKEEKAKYDELAGETGVYLEGAKKAKDALSRGKSGKMPRDPNAFLQVAKQINLSNLIRVARLDSSDKETMLAFMQGDYHTVGGEIIGILDNMIDDFKKSLGALVEEEEAAVKSYLALKSAKETEIAAATKSIETKSELKGQAAVEAVEHKAAAAAALKEKEDGEKFQANLAVSCKTKEEDWAARSAMRADELSAIADAIAVLNDDDALDIFKKAAFPQTKTSFLQLRGSVKNVKARAAGILKGMKFSSPILNLMAAKTSHKLSTAVDFSPILVMIDDMIKVLKADQAHDEESKSTCNENFNQNEKDTKETTKTIASLESEIEALAARIEELKELINKKEIEVSELDKQAKEATEIRAEENKEFLALIALNNSAVQLIEKAKNKLHRFYNPGQYKAPEERELTEEERLLQGAGQDIGDTTATTAIAGTEQVTTVFLQISAPSLAPPPETYGEHKAKSQKSSSVIALLDVMQQDLAKETQKAEHDEKIAQRDYEQLMADTAESRAAAVASIAEANEALAGAGESKSTAESSLAQNQEILVELQKTLASLHAECDFIIAHFEERLEARNTEIDGLTTAKSVLSGANFK